MSMGALLPAAARRASASALPNARILTHQPSGGFQGQSTDIEIHARETLALRERLDALYAQHTGQRVRDPRRHGARSLLHRRGGQGLRPGRHRHQRPSNGNGAAQPSR